MSSTNDGVTGPDLRTGVPVDRIHDGGMLLGQVDNEPVLVARRGVRFFAIGATCTHYSGPLAEGLVVGDTVRCPHHHACFSLLTGEALRAPALAPVACYEVARRLDMIYVTRKLETTTRATRLSMSAAQPKQIVIVGAGAAGTAAALALRQEGYTGRLTLLGAEAAAPYDRPNLSKDYLAGNAPEEWLPLKPPEEYRRLDIQLVTGTAVTKLDAAGKQVSLADGQAYPFDALLLATGAEPVRLPIPGADQPHVYYLRSLADSRAIIAAAATAKRAVVMGASFIGLEVAASLRARDIEVHVVAPEARPLERILGPELGDYIRGLHVARGVVFHLGQTAGAVKERSVILKDGTELPADLVVIGAGVRPVTDLAERAGLTINQGVEVDQFLETSSRGIFAAGDVARWPSPRAGGAVRIEHWVVAERMGQTAARNMLGARLAYRAVPFFWSQHYETRVNYVGHAERWDRIDSARGLPPGVWEQRFIAGGRVMAVATIGRDLESLKAEVSLE
jgi:NADPH-dependent 2,4-dienoyl-CoA reductase/sulfur reductase-like enzyme/nitrite reductase/ring-hydroxylating ferredoxin subunit